MRDLASRKLAAAGLLLAMVACSTDTPTAPERTPAPPPGSTGTATTWSINVTVEPRDVPASSAQPATVSVEVRRTDDGRVPQDGTTVVVSAGLGEFNSAGSGETTATLILRAGRAALLYFAGAILGTDTIEARLENSIGSARVNIFQEDILFIQTVAPDRGPQSGGTRIRISGTGFEEPLRVTLGPGANGVSINAAIDAVGVDAQGGFIRAITGEVLSPDDYFLTEGCDSDGDGTLDGVRSVTTVVGVNVELFPSGDTDSLPQAFAYRPRDRSCRVLMPGPNPPDPPDAPVADFSFIISGASTEVKFFNESTPDTGLTFFWDFGDGSAIGPTNSEENPVHDYTAAGSGMDFDVTLRVENASGISTRTRTVSIP